MKALFSLLVSGWRRSWREPDAQSQQRRYQQDEWSLWLTEEHACCGLFILVFFLTIFRKLFLTGMETVQVTWSFLPSFLFMLSKILMALALCPQLPLSTHQQWLRLQPVATVTPTQTAQYRASLNRGAQNTLMSQQLGDNQFRLILFVQGKRRVWGGDCSAFTFQTVPPWGRGAAGAARGDGSGSLQGERTPKASEWSRGYISPAGTRSIAASGQMASTGSNAASSWCIQLFFVSRCCLMTCWLRGVRQRCELLKTAPPEGFYQLHTPAEHWKHTPKMLSDPL